MGVGFTGADSAEGALWEEVSYLLFFIYEGKGGVCTGIYFDKGMYLGGLYILDDEKENRIGNEEGFAGGRSARSFSSWQNIYIPLVGCVL